MRKKGKQLSAFPKEYTCCLTALIILCKDEYEHDQGTQSNLATWALFHVQLHKGQESLACYPIRSICSSVYEFKMLLKRYLVCVTYS